jgi:hypothetical protein
VGSGASRSESFISDQGTLGAQNVGRRPAVAVVIGAELRQSQCPTAGELSQGGMAGLWQGAKQEPPAPGRVLPVWSAPTSVRGLVACYRGVPTAAGQTGRMATDSYRGFGIRHDSDALYQLKCQHAQR